MRSGIPRWAFASLIIGALILGVAVAGLAQQAPPAPPAQAAAPPPPKVDSGDNAWMLTSSALVLLMTIPGLALFYGGMVRRQNVLGTIMQSFIIVALISIEWILWGYTTAFGPDVRGLVGDLSWFGLRGVGLDPNPDYAATIPHQTFMIYQMMFAIITPALIAGAFADRMKFSALLWFMGLWLIVVYAPVAHMVWGGGLMGGMGVLDYAGGTVVHINAGVAGLVSALVLGKRMGYGKTPFPPNNLVYSLIGASLLWVGWFGFNAGSAVAADARAGMAMAVTQIATAAAALGWMFAEWLTKGKPSVLGIISGAVAGLVAITPASGFVLPGGAIVIGVVAGVACFIASTWLKNLLGYDDSLDAFGVHGIGGIIGAVLTGVFATMAVTGAADPVGLVDGNAGQVFTQIKGVVVTIVYCGVATFVVLKVIDLIIGLRVSEDVERDGLDLSLHGELVP